MGLKEGEEGREGAPASDADGRSPREPGMTLVSSESLKWYVYGKKERKDRRRQSMCADEKKKSWFEKTGGLTCPRIDSPSAPRR